MSAILSSSIHYGYLLLGSNSEEITEAMTLNQYLPEPFFVACLLPSVSLDATSLDDIPVRHVVFGVTVDTDTDVEQLLLWREQMDEMLSNRFLEGFQFATAPRFYSGVPWMPSEGWDESDVSDVSDVSEISDLYDSAEESDKESDEDSVEEEYL